MKNGGSFLCFMGQFTRLIIFHVLQVGPGRFSLLCPNTGGQQGIESQLRNRHHHIHVPLSPNEVSKKPKNKRLPELVKFIFSILLTQWVNFMFSILLMILIPSPIDILVTTQKPCFSRGMNLRALGIWAIGRTWLASLYGSYSQWSIYCTSIYYDLLMWSSLFQWFLWPQYPNISKHPFSDSLRKTKKNMFFFSFCNHGQGMSRHREKGVVRQVLGIVPNVPVGLAESLKMVNYWKWWTIGNGERGSMWTTPYGYLALI